MGPTFSSHAIGLSTEPLYRTWGTGPRRATFQFQPAPPPAQPPTPTIPACARDPLEHAIAATFVTVTPNITPMRSLRSLAVHDDATDLRWHEVPEPNVRSHFGQVRGEVVPPGHPVAHSPAAAAPSPRSVPAAQRGTQWTRRESRAPRPARGRSYSRLADEYGSSRGKWTRVVTERFPISRAPLTSWEQVH